MYAKPTVFPEIFGTSNTLTPLESTVKDVAPVICAAL